jgi:hypothetical protein
MHRENTHPDPVPGCWACEHPPPNVAASAMPSRSPDAVAISERERRWKRDMPAYARMRRDGVQPRSIDGAAHIETHASDRVEVESGTILPTRRQRQDATSILEDFAA